MEEVQISSKEKFTDTKMFHHLCKLHISFSVQNKSTWVFNITSECVSWTSGRAHHIIQSGLYWQLQYRCIPISLDNYAIHFCNVLFYRGAKMAAATAEFHNFRWNSGLLHPQKWLHWDVLYTQGVDNITFSLSVRWSHGLNTSFPSPSLVSLRHCSFSMSMRWYSAYSRPRSAGSCSSSQQRWPDIAGTNYISHFREM